MRRHGGGVSASFSFIYIFCAFSSSLGPIVSVFRVGMLTRTSYTELYSHNLVSHRPLAHLRLLHNQGQHTTHVWKRQLSTLDVAQDVWNESKMGWRLGSHVERGWKLFVAALSWPGSDEVRPWPAVNWLDFDWRVMMGQGTTVRNFLYLYNCAWQYLSDS